MLCKYSLPPQRPVCLAQVLRSVDPKRSPSFSTPILSVDTERLLPWAIGDHRCARLEAKAETAEAALEESALD